MSGEYVNIEIRDLNDAVISNNLLMKYIPEGSHSITKIVYILYAAYHTHQKKSLRLSKDVFCAVSGCSRACAQLNLEDACVQLKKYCYRSASNTIFVFTEAFLDNGELCVTFQDDFLKYIL